MITFSYKTYAILYKLFDLFRVINEDKQNSMQLTPKKSKLFNKT